MCPNISCKTRLLPLPMPLLHCFVSLMCWLSISQEFQPFPSLTTTAETHFNCFPNLILKITGMYWISTVLLELGKNSDRGIFCWQNQLSKKSLWSMFTKSLKCILSAYQNITQLTECITLFILLGYLFNCILNTDFK